MNGGGFGESDACNCGIWGKNQIKVYYIIQSTT